MNRFRLRQRDFSFFGVLPVKKCHVANPLHEYGTAPVTQFGDRRVARLSIPDPYRDLDQFVMPERGRKLRKYGAADAAVTDHDGRLQAMSEAPQMFTLSFGQFHGAQCNSVFHGGTIR